MVSIPLLKRFQKEQNTCLCATEITISYIVVEIMMGIMLSRYEGLNSRTYHWHCIETLYSVILQEIVLLVMLSPIILTHK